MIPDDEVARLEATATARGNSDLGRALRRFLREHELLRAEHVAASAAAIDWHGSAAMCRFGDAHAAVEDYR